MHACRPGLEPGEAPLPAPLLAVLRAAPLTGERRSLSGLLVALAPDPLGRTLPAASLPERPLGGWARIPPPGS